MNKLYWLFLTALLCSCSQDWSRGIETTRSAAASQGIDRPVTVAGTARAARKFANAPDLGALVQYPKHAATRRMGAYSWHPVGLSEDHALNAIVDGELTMTAPDGSTIQLRYDRHIEHPDGNWTWIGRSRADSGQTAVITFGETAAFGSIPQGRGELPLRLTVMDGRPWIVSTDREQLRQVHNEATHPAAPDYFIPPKLAAGSSGTPGITAASASMAAVGPAAATVVDVLVGYTNGFAANLGGQSAAQTRIHNLVDITNEAYVTSQISARIRLVRAMQVTYPDATDNGTALEEMTGFRAPSTRLPPAPAFSALRAARDQYGADLVTLVRQFNTPENAGCGIAWLIGGGARGIDQEDGDFGYSVVSDGQDRDTDGKTYFCREETFAHELGHNMGSQHDAATAENKPGAYAWSYGYKTAAGAGNFYTIMAYGDEGQNRYRVFSNPRITACGERACGVTNQADNARSLGLTMPTIASFRATVVPGAAPAVDDFDGDGKSDALWRNATSGANAIWRSASSATQQPVTAVPAAAWRIVGAGEFNGDGVSDILWRNSNSGANTIWRSGNSATAQAVTTVPAGAWNIAGVGDFDGDGVSDILWRNSNSGANTIWRSANSATGQAVTAVAAGAWQIVGVGDFNGDGRADILWRNSSTGGNTIWRSGSSATQQAVTTIPDAAWKVAGVGDFNGDSQSDIVWRNTSTGVNTIWRSANSATDQAAATVSSQAWQIVATGDYDGDGQSDLFWRNSSTGANAIWRSAQASTQVPVTAVPNAAWSVQG